MVAPLVAAGGLSLLGGIIGGKGASKAASAQVKSAREAMAMSDRQFQQTREDFAPWREAGGEAIGSLSAMLQPDYDYKASPGYDFRFSEGQRAVESGGAAKGGLFSGGTLKDLVRFGDGVAADDFNQQFARTATVAGMGQQGVNATAQMGQNAAQYGGNAAMGAGNARASGYVGQANALTGMLNNFAGMAMMGGGGGGASGGFGYRGGFGG